MNCLTPGIFAGLPDGFGQFADETLQIGIEDRHLLLRASDLGAKLRPVLRVITGTALMIKAPITTASGRFFRMTLLLPVGGQTGIAASTGWPRGRDNSKHHQFIQK